MVIALGVTPKRRNRRALSLSYLLVIVLPFDIYGKSATKINIYSWVTGKTRKLFILYV